MAEKIARRRLFGLVGALAFAAAVPPTVAAAAPVESPTSFTSGSLTAGVDGIVASATIETSADSILVSTSSGPRWLSMPVPGEEITANVAQASIKANVEAIRTAIGPKGAEMHVTITADTSQLRAELADLEWRARYLSAPPGMLAVFAEDAAIPDGWAARPDLEGGRFFQKTGHLWDA